jgi:hypothetical protein
VGERLTALSHLGREGVAVAACPQRLVDRLLIAQPAGILERSFGERDPTRFARVQQRPRQDRAGTRSQCVVADAFGELDRFVRLLDGRRGSLAEAECLRELQFDDDAEIRRCGRLTQRRPQELDLTTDHAASFLELTGQQQRLGPDPTRASRVQQAVGVGMRAVRCTGREVVARHGEDAGRSAVRILRRSGADGQLTQFRRSDRSAACSGSAGRRVKPAGNHLVGPRCRKRSVSRLLHWIVHQPGQSSVDGATLLLCGVVVQHRREQRMGEPDPDAVCVDDPRAHRRRQ